LDINLREGAFGWEEFYVSDNKEIITYFSAYLNAGPGSNADVQAATWTSTWEKWNIISNEDGTFCIQNNEHGNYLSATSDLEATTASSCGSAEKWVLIKV